MICEHFGYKSGTHLIKEFTYNFFIATTIKCEEQVQNISQCTFTAPHKRHNFYVMIKCFKTRFLKRK